MPNAVIVILDILHEVSGAHFEGLYSLRGIRCPFRGSVEITMTYITMTVHFKVSIATGE